MPAAEQCVLPLVLDRLAETRPGHVFAVFEDGEEWTYARTRQEARQVASALERLEAKRADRILIWLPNGKLALKSWFGVNWLGAVSVAINTAYRGNLLSHVVSNSDARLAICHPDLIDRLLEIEDRGRLDTILTSGEKAAERGEAFRAAGIQLLALDALEVACSDLKPADLLPWDLQSICYTSGTTGPSKGVMSGYLHLHTMGWNCTDGVDETDRYLINLPLFHVGGTLFTTGALARGASIAILDQYATSTFFDSCRRLRATQCLLLGAMAGFLMRSPPSESDTDHPLRRVMVIPLSEDAPAMRARFGFDVVTLFNMSEISAPIVSDLNPTARGSCGRLRAGYDARLVDEHDCEVPPGTTGELILRAECPWTLFHGYYKMPEATAKAWRNGWFHTGDLFRRDEAGNYFFVDRSKDAIRRRGENISSFEVESEALAYPHVAEAAAVGVPSENSEEEVLLVVVPKPGARIDPAEITDFLVKRLPYFMVPAFIRLADALPKTPTSKVEKHRLRQEGVTADTWHRDVAGIRVKRERLS
jgi:crotonobetaine/carnitine-CoA ligase